MLWRLGGNNVVALVGLTDQTTGALVTSATVTTRLQLLSGAVTAYPNGGVDVAGFPWPLILAYVSPGSFTGVATSALVVTAGLPYQLYTVATDGTTTAPWVDFVTVTH